jgi:hypothetical protein
MRKKILAVGLVLVLVMPWLSSGQGQPATNAGEGPSSRQAHLRRQ